MPLTPSQVEILLDFAPFRAAVEKAVRSIEQMSPWLAQMEQRRKAQRAHVLYRQRRKGRW